MPDLFLYKSHGAISRFYPFTVENVSVFNDFTFPCNVGPSFIYVIIFRLIRCSIYHVLASVH